MRPRLFTWLDITELYSVDGQNGNTLDGVVEGEVRSEKEEKRCFRQLGDGFDCIRSRGTLTETFFGSSGGPLCPQVPQNGQNGKTTA
jgi:hypothetical protein